MKSFLNVFASPNMKDASSSSSSHFAVRDRSGVRVVVRVRPHTEKELSFGQAYAQSCVNVVLQNNRPRVCQLLTRPSQQFTFDYVAAPDITQEDMFESVGRPVIESCLSGYNGTIFCYGQTGAGKTYTMLGPQIDDPRSNLAYHMGLIPRAINNLFEEIATRIAQSQGTVEFLCKCSFLEIYNEKITDLLADQADGASKALRKLTTKSQDVHFFYTHFALFFQ